MAELIRKGEFGELKDIVAKGVSDGMQTFDQSLYQLYSDGKISKNVALEFAGSRNDLEWQINFGAQQNLSSAQKANKSELPALM